MTDFKPGDKVTCQALVGEWVVDARCDIFPASRWWWLRNGRNQLPIAEHLLTLVAPPLPPEPAVGEGVFVDGVLWRRLGGAWLTHWGNANDDFVRWSDIAADADRAVPEKAHRAQVIAEVVAWLRRSNYRPLMVADDIEREIGDDR